MKLRTKLGFLIMLTVVLSTILIANFSFSYSKKSLEQNKLEALESIAKLKAGNIENFFANLKTNIIVSQDFYNVKTNLPLLCRLCTTPDNPEFIAATKMLDEQLIPMRDALHLEGIILLSDEGDIVYDNNPRYALEGAAQHLKAGLTQAFEGGKKDVFLGDVFMTEETEDEFDVLISAPITGFNKNFAGVIVFEIDMGQIYNIIKDRSGLGQTGETLVAQEKDGGIRFLHPLLYDTSAALQKKIIFGDTVGRPIQEAVHGNTGKGLSIDYRGEKVLAYWQPLPSLDWGFVAKVDTDEVFADINILKLIVALGTAIAIILISIIILLFARSFTKPIEKLDKMAHIIAQGNFNYKIEDIKSNDEIGHLAQSFNIMVAKLKESYEDLEEKVKDRTRELEQIVDYSPAIVFYKDRENRIIRANQTMVNITGLSKHEIEGKPLADIEIFSEYARKYWDDDKKVMNSGKARLNIIEQLNTKNGMRWVSTDKFPYKDRDGKVIGIIGFAVDITEQRKAEEEVQKYIKELELTKARNEGILMAIGDGLVVIDKNNKIIMVNSAFENLTGWTQKEAIAKSMVEIIPMVNEEGTIKPTEERILSRIISGKNGKFGILEAADASSWYYVRKNKTKFPVTAVATPIVVRGEMIGAVEIFHDITEAQKINKAQNEFLTLAAHQLRTPLSITKWVLESFMEEKALKKNHKEKLADLYISNERVIGLVGSFLSAARLETGKIIAVKKPTDILKLIKISCNIYKLKAGKKKQKIKVAVQTEVKTTQLDQILFSETFNNLLNNAISYAPEKAVIEVAIGTKNEHYIISVHNSGSFIPEEDKKRIFERFYRREVESIGTGLGLYVAKAAVEANGGAIWFESNQEEGTTFYFTVPKK